MTTARRPAKYGSPEWRENLVAARRERYRRDGYVNPELIAGEIKDYLDTNPVVDGKPMSRRRFALIAGLPPTTCNELLLGRRSFLHSQHAKQIEKALRKLGWDRDD